MRPVAVVGFVCAMFLSACSPTTSSEPVPPLNDAADAQLQARTLMRACRDVMCSGWPIYAPDSTSESVRAAVLPFTDEVEYLSPIQLDERYSDAGRFSDRATWFDIGAPQATEQADVLGVDVWISRGRYDAERRTYLFLWDGTEWIDTSPDAVDVTVTSSVS